VNCSVNLPSGVGIMLSKLSKVLRGLDLVDYVVITGSVARCLAGEVDCNSVGDLDALLTGEAVVMFLDSIKDLLNEGFSTSLRPNQ